MTPKQIEEHNLAFKEAVQLVDDKILIEGRSKLSSKLPAAVRSKLERALQLFDKCLELNPSNWSAMWMQGKVYQVLGNDSEALRLFLRALEINPSQVDVAREASISAMAINRSEDAIYYARRALQSQPSNVGLKANLALALLLAGKLPEAKEVIDNAVATGKADTITRTLSSMIEHFIATGEKPPTTATALEDYWRNMGST